MDRNREGNVFPSIAGGTYLIEGSPDLVNWTRIDTISATGEETTYRCPQNGAPHYFYRAAFTR